VVDDISHEGLQVLLREEGVSFQRVRTWKALKDPHCAAEKARAEHLFAAYEPGEDKLFGHVKPRKTRSRSWSSAATCALSTPSSVQIAVICDNFSPHLTARRDARVGTWAAEALRAGPDPGLAKGGPGTSIRRPVWRLCRPAQHLSRLRATPAAKTWISLRTCAVHRHRVCLPGMTDAL
jgi:hypothetical protein